MCTSASALKSHLLQTHGHALHANDIESLVQKRASKPSKISEVMCPLCQQVLSSTKMYMKHVGRHQEDLALFALPKLEGPDEPLNEGDESGVSEPSSCHVYR